MKSNYVLTFEQPSVSWVGERSDATSLLPRLFLVKNVPRDSHTPGFQVFLNRDLVLASTISLLPHGW